MKKIPNYISLIFFLLILNSIEVLSDEQWIHYCNERFGQCADIPANLKKMRPPDNGDGQTFVSTDGFKVSIWASWNIDNYDVTEDLKAYGDQEGVVTYQVLKNNWFVQSGVNGDKIFYEKHIVNKNIVSGMRMEYPKLKKNEYNSIVGRIAKSLIAAPDDQ